MIRLGTLFSGIGAIEQALLKMNIEHRIVFACDNGEREINKSIEQLNSILDTVPVSQRKKKLAQLYDSTGKKNHMELSYKANYEIADDNFYQDVRFFPAIPYRNRVDLIVGGSPCQAFSCNGKRGGLDDTRGTLFYDYARIIQESQPKCFIFENVRGMINHDRGKTWCIIKNVFNNLNYNIYIKHDADGNETPLLNAADYGIPQLRQRIFLIGIRNDIRLKSPFSFPEPIGLTTTVNDYLDPEVLPKYYLGKKGFEFVTTHPTRAQVGIPVMTCQKANQQFNWNGTFIFEELSDKHSPAILNKAYVGDWNGKRGVIRMITPRECLRLMGFPDTFNIVVNDHMMWRQCGNSIVVNVLESLMTELINTGVFDD